ncbi:hypothetical protein JCM8547_007193 [Rhodosporidiobolus lusitaniae]
MINPLKRNKVAAHDNAATTTAHTHGEHGQTKKRGLVMRDELVAMVAEFVGTTLFIFFACGGVHSAKMLATNIRQQGQIYRGEGDGPGGAYDTSNLQYISLATAFSYAILLWMFYRVTTGLFNPAMSVALAIAGWLKPARLLYLIPAQLLGSIAGAGLIAALTPGDFHALTVITADIEYSRATFLEVFGTALLALSVLFLMTERRRSSHLGPLGVGIAYWIALLTVTLWTGGSLNPARSFGPAVIMTSFPGYHWIYWVGPMTGAFIAATFYRFIKFIGYDGFAHSDQHWTASRGYGHNNYGNNTASDLESGHGNVAGAGAHYGGNTSGGAGKVPFMTRTAARDQSSADVHLGSGAARDDGCSSQGNYQNRGGIGAGPEHTGLHHSRGDGAVHYNDRTDAGAHVGRGLNEKGDANYGHSDVALTSRLDRIESLLLSHNNTQHSPTTTLGVAGATRTAGRPSHETVVEEGPYHEEGHKWKEGRTGV